MPISADGPQTGTIDGTITDAQGGGLPGVSVTLTGPQNTRNAITDAEGDYRFALLQPGAYTVNATLEGLGTAERAVSLDAGQRQDVSLTLQAATSETITVTSEAAMISKYDTGATSAIPEEALENVTFTTRNYNTSVQMLPGLVQRRQEDAARPSVNGGIRTEIGVFIDGVDVSMPRRGGELRFQIPSTVIHQYPDGNVGFRRRVRPRDQRCHELDDQDRHQQLPRRFFSILARTRSGGPRTGSGSSVLTTRSTGFEAGLGWADLARQGLVLRFLQRTE